MLYLYQQFFFVDSLPYTPSGKVMKYKLREQYKNYKDSK